MRHSYLQTNYVTRLHFEQGITPHNTHAISSSCLCSLAFRALGLRTIRGLPVRESTPSSTEVESTSCLHTSQRFVRTMQIQRGGY
jgi:hypothetical protein